MSFVDKVVSQVLHLEVTLRHAVARLAANTDNDALHDLRTSVRRLRSLIRPLRSKDDVWWLDEAADEVGDLTTPVRDLEVLVEELEKRGLVEPARPRQLLLATGYAAILESSTLHEFFARLEQWPSQFRTTERIGDLDKLKKHVAKRLRKQLKKLGKSLADPQRNRHRTRIRVKRLRYATAAYPKLSPVSSKAPKQLKTAQSALGSWHDNFQWARRAEKEVDLQPLLAIWTHEAEQAARQADGEQETLAKKLGLPTPA